VRKPRKVGKLLCAQVEGGVALVIAAFLAGLRGLARPTTPAQERCGREKPQPEARPAMRSPCYRTFVPPHQNLWVEKWGSGRAPSW
jgi:hypothetical protein